MAEVEANNHNSNAEAKLLHLFLSQSTNTYEIILIWHTVLPIHLTQSVPTWSTDIIYHSSS